MHARAIFADAEQRRILSEKFFSVATPANIMSDARTFLNHLAAQSDVRPGGIGTTGYCLRGFMPLTAAGTFPERILATASCHAGRLATDGRTVRTCSPPRSSRAPGSITASRPTPPGTGGCRATRRCTMPRRRSGTGRL
jgi:dienelactone hydrolase